MNLQKLKISFYLSLVNLLLNFKMVSAHGGHPEDQIIDGIDNNVLAYGTILIGLIIVMTIAYIQGKKARALQTSL